MPIPIFRFPLVALNEVIKNIDPRQLFTLSLCSKKMHQVGKNLRDKSHKLELQLEGSKRIAMHLFEKNNSVMLFKWIVCTVTEDLLDGWSVDRFRGAVFQEDYYDFISYWQDVEAGTRCLLEHICDLFGVRFKLVDLSNDLLLWTLDWIEQRQGPRSYGIVIRDVPLTNQQFRHLLVDLNPSSLDLNTAPSEFQIEPFHKTYDILQLTRGKWLTGENLLTLDCSRLRVFEKKFTVAEINRFLRHVLIDGGAPRLTDFQAHVRGEEQHGWIRGARLVNPGSNGILRGIREVLAPIPGERRLDNDLFWNLNGMLIRGERSVLVSISCYRSFFELKLT